MKTLFVGGPLGGKYIYIDKGIIHYRCLDDDKIFDYERVKLYDNQKRIVVFYSIDKEKGLLEYLLNFYREHNEA